MGMAADPPVEVRVAAAPSQTGEVQQLLLELGVALTMTGDAVSEIQQQLRAVAMAYGHAHARISVGPTLLIIAIADGEPASMATVDSIRTLRLDQASDVIGISRAAAAALVDPGEARAALRRIIAAPPRFGNAARIAAHGLLTIGLALVMRPAAVDLWVYAALGALVGAMKVLAARLGRGSLLVGIVAAAVVAGIAFLAHDGNEAASLRLTIPPLVTFLPGALLAMATVDLAMGETVAGASRFVAGLLQLTLLGIGIVIGGELVGDPHRGPVAGPAADTLGAWSPWAGVLLFGVGVFIHNVAPRRSLPWLLIVLFAAWIGELAGEHVLDSTLSGFIGAAVMVPVAHLVAQAHSAPPAHVMFLPAFWLLVPGTIGLIGITELVGDSTESGTDHFLNGLIATGSVALGILVGTMIVRSARMATRGAHWAGSGNP